MIPICPRCHYRCNKVNTVDGWIFCCVICGATPQPSTPEASGLSVESVKNWSKEIKNMIPIVIGDKTYGLAFEHRTIPLNVAAEKPRLANKVTTARIFVEGNTFPLVEGRAECSVKDMFVKEKGRKVALTRLLKKWNVNKDARTAVWEQYLNRTKKKVPVIDGVPV